MVNSQKRRVAHRKDVRLEKVVKVCLTEGDARELSAAAKRVGIGVSTWLRLVGLREARRREAP